MSIGRVSSRLVVASAAAILFLASIASAQSPQEQAARKSAEDWLTLVDSGKYAESWQEAASLFKSQVSQDQWESKIRAVREPLGKVRSRKLKSSQYTTSVPGAPDGEYVAIQYDTTLEHKKVAVETVTPMLDKDGTWRVSGYFIK